MKERSFQVQLHVDCWSGKVLHDRCDRSSVVPGIVLHHSSMPEYEYNLMGRQKSCKSQGLNLASAQLQDFLTIYLWAHIDTKNLPVALDCSVFWSCILFFALELTHKVTLRCDIKKKTSWRMSFLLVRCWGLFLHDLRSNARAFSHFGQLVLE